MTDKEAKAELNWLWAERRERLRRFAPLPTAIEVSPDFYVWLVQHAGAEGYENIIEWYPAPVDGGVITRVFGIPFRRARIDKNVRLIE